MSKNTKSSSNSVWKTLLGVFAFILIVKVIFK